MAKAVLLESGTFDGRHVLVCEIVDDEAHFGGDETWDVDEYASGLALRWKSRVDRLLDEVAEVRASDGGPRALSRSALFRAFLASVEDSLLRDELGEDYDPDASVPRWLRDRAACRLLDFTLTPLHPDQFGWFECGPAAEQAVLEALPLPKWSKIVSWRLTAGGTMRGIWLAEGRESDDLREWLIARKRERDADRTRQSNAAARLRASILNRVDGRQKRAVNAKEPRRSRKGPSRR